MQHQITKLLTSGVIVGLGLACGGGGGSSGSSTTADLVTDSSATSDKTEVGTFVDSAVVGLSYVTETLTGFTDENGQFYYRNGETVTFMLGDTVLGESDGSEMVTPADLLGVEKTSDDRRLANMLRLLQSIDADGDPDNGIEITEAFREAKALELDFDLSEDDFTYSDALSELMNLSPRDLVAAQDALDHFTKSLERRNDAHGNFEDRGLAYTDPDVFMEEQDADGSGNLSQEEFVMEPSEALKARWDFRFSVLDSNSSGGIDEDEWLVAHHDFDEEDFDEDDFNDENFEDDFDEDDFNDEDLDIDEIDEEDVGDEESEVNDLETEDSDLDDESTDSDNNENDSEEDVDTEDEEDAEADENDDDFDFDDFDDVDEDEFDDFDEDDDHERPAFADVDTNGDLIISQDEWNVVREAQFKAHQVEIFSDIDVNQDGEISLAELMDEDEDDEHGSDQHKSKLIDRFDMDGDGALSIDEFLADLDGVEAEDALEHFDTMDTDGDGFLEKGEISVGPKRDARERREARFETQDIDSDGFLSLDEYLTEVPEQHVDKATERFAAMDIDEDGGLGIDEITGCKK